MIFLVDIDKAVISRLNIAGQKFEILVDPKKAYEFKQGKQISLDEILAYPAIYKNARAAEEASIEDLQKFFGTTDVYKIAEKIIKNGEIQLTTKQKRELIEQKKLQIATIISKRGVNPQTNAPHPVQRILTAMEKSGVNIDPFQDAEQQVEKVLKSIRGLIPIKFEKITLQLKIPAQYCAKVYSQIRNFGNILNEKWLGDGSLQIEIEILAGMQQEFFEKISNLTEGNFESKIVKRVET